MKKLCLVFALAAVTASGAPNATLTDKGLALDCGGMGTFTLSVPEIEIDGKRAAPVEVRVSGSGAALAYANGVKAKLDLNPPQLVVTFTAQPVPAGKMTVGVFVPPNYQEGGRWEIGSARGEFPRLKGKAFLFQDHARDFNVFDPQGKRLSLSFPEYTYVQLQDNREWNWNIFYGMFVTPVLPGADRYVYSFALDASAAQSAAAIDRFGQPLRDFPGKVKSEAEFAGDRAAEAAYYKGFARAAVDKWGGIPGSGRKLGLKATGFFHVEKKRSWLLVDPDGEACFHLGICGFGSSDDYTAVENRKELFAWIPPHEGAMAEAWHPDKWWNSRAVSFYKANVIRKYGSFDAEALAGRMVERVRAVGFNAAGAFSPAPAAFASLNFPRVSTLPLNAWQFAPAIPGVRGIFDPFDEGLAARMDRLFAEKVAPSAGDPLIIGYFLDNEQAFEDLPRAVPALPAKHPCKRELVRQLRGRYADIAAFNAAWKADAPDFESLAERGLAVTTQAAYEDMRRYTESFLEKYYSLIAASFRKCDRNHLLLGNRWQPGTANSEALCRIAGRYMDVISVNYYTCGVDTAFVKRIYDWSGGRPQMWSEFYFTAAAESAVSASNNDMPTQKARGEAYRDYAGHAAATGFVIGIEWFTLIDQATAGRFFEGANGERANTGLFNVADRPYKDCLAEMARANAEIPSVWLDGAKPFTCADPRFGKAGNARRAVSAGRLAADGAFPGRPPERIGADRLALGRGAAGTEAAFKAAWDEKNLYLRVQVKDDTPMQNEQGGADLWNGDGLEVFIGHEAVDEGGPLRFTDRQVLLGAGHGNQAWLVNAPEQPAIVTTVARDVDGKGYVLEAAIPWPAVGVRAGEGMELLFDLAVDNAAKPRQRDLQLMWNGGARNSSDRGAWGRLRLVR
jgi:hypothetical protein